MYSYYEKTYKENLHFGGGYIVPCHKCGDPTEDQFIGKKYNICDACSENLTDQEVKDAEALLKVLLNLSRSQEIER